MSVLLGKLRGVARRTKAAVSPRAVILLYHRVADAPPGTDPFNLCVAPTRFAEQMEVLTRAAQVLPLVAVAKHIADRTLPHRCAAVTFDDGYADNLLIARPILERLGVPATVFATTGTAGRTEEFYWDECERLILGAPNTPRRFRIRGRAAGPEWALDTDDAGERRRTCAEVCDAIRDLTPPARREAVDGVREWCGSPAVPVRPERRALTDEELVRLAADGLIELGAHTENHPALPTLSPAEQFGEISRSKARLEALLGRRVDSFAYPYGLHSDASVEAVRRAGFRRACTTEEHAARHASEALRLPRFDTGDCDGDAFERKLRWAFGR